MFVVLQIVLKKQHSQHYDGNKSKSGDNNMRATLTSEKALELFEANDEVNNNMSYVTDLEQYGKLEEWVHIPGQKGDCEDFARAKELKLRSLGWDSNCMGRATCWPEWSDQYHCVLLVNTDRGTYVLDMNSDPMPWNKANIRKWSIIPDYILEDMDTPPELTPRS